MMRQEKRMIFKQCWRWVFVITYAVRGGGVVKY